MARTTVPNELVAVNAIQGTLIADNAITAVHIATNAVSGTLIADNAVTSTHIAQNHVTGTQISQNTITVTHLADNAVETAKINGSAVTTAKINNGAVTEDKLAANSVTSAKIVNGTIVTADLADDAVTIAKMAALARGKIIYGDSSGAPAALALGSNGQVLKSDGTDIAWATLSTGVDGISSSADATAITIDSSERVGIGVTSVDAKLHVDGEVRIQSSTEDGTSLFSIYNENTNPDSEQFFIAMNGSSVEMGNARSNALDFFTSDTRRMRITSGGYVGVGTTSPQGELHLVGASGAPVRLYLSDVDDGTGAGDSLLITKSGATAYIYNRDDGDLRLGTNDDNDMLTVDTGGNIGTGTNSPDAKFHSYQTAANYAAHFESANANSYGVWIEAGSSANNGYPLLSITDNGGSSTYFRVDSGTGNVGIGTSSPAFTAGSGLEISRAGAATLRLEDTDGTTGATELVQVDADGYLLTRQASSALIFGINSSEMVRLNSSGSWIGGITAQQGIGGTPADANSFELGRGYLNLARDDTADAKQITFGKNGAVHSYLETTSGGLNIGGTVVGIGTTDFTAMGSSSYKGLKVGGAVLQDSGGGTGGATFWGQNAYVGGSNNFYHDSGGTCSGIQMTSGDINFYTFDGGGGSADAQWSPSARMHIKENGQVGIGTTTMLTNAKLTVDGGDMMVQGANNSCGISDLLPGYTRGDYGVVHSSANHVYFSVGSSYVSYINGGDGTFNVSDQRLKENVATLTGTLDKVKQLRGVSFTWKDTEERGTDTKIGLIAQEVEAVYPQLVDDGGLPKDNEGNDPYKSVNYAHLTSVLIEAIKELDTKLTAAEARIKTLEDA